MVEILRGKSTNTCYTLSSCAHLMQKLVQVMALWRQASLDYNDLTLLCHGTYIWHIAYSSSHYLYQWLVIINNNSQCNRQWIFCKINKLSLDALNLLCLAICSVTTLLFRGMCVNHCIVIILFHAKQIIIWLDSIIHIHRVICIVEYVAKR